MAVAVAMTVLLSEAVAVAMVALLPEGMDMVAAVTAIESEVVEVASARALRAPEAH